MRVDTFDIILFHDRQSTPERYEVSVRIRKREIFLCRFTDINEAAAFMNKWVANRGYQFGPDSYRRVDEAQRTDAILLTLECVRVASKDASETAL